MLIEFPAGEIWNGNREIVLFDAKVDGNSVRCAISLEALQDNYGGDRLAPIDCFRANRRAIETKAERLIGRGRFEEDGSVLIRSHDGA